MTLNKKSRRSDRTARRQRRRCAARRRREAYALADYTLVAAARLIAGAFFRQGRREQGVDPGVLNAAFDNAAALLRGQGDFQ